MAEEGNVVRTSENAQRAERANQGILLYDRLSTGAGPIDDVLDRSAGAEGLGANSNDVKQQACRQIRTELTDQVGKLAGVPQGNGRGAEGLGPQGPLQAGSGEHDRGPQLSQRVDEPSEPSEPPRAQAIQRTGAQLVGTLRVNQGAADVLRDAYSFAGGRRQGSFDGQAVQSADVRLLLKGLDGMAGEGHPAAGAIAAELREASAKGLRGVAIAGPESESHEQLHLAVDKLKFDADEILQHGPTRVAAIEARSRGLASGSDERVIREVMTRIFGAGHESLKVGESTSRAITEHFLEHAAPETGALDTLEELAHERHQATIRGAGERRTDTGTEAGGGEEPGPAARYRQEAGRPGGYGGVRPRTGGEETGEGPELARRRIGRGQPDPTEQSLYGYLLNNPGGFYVAAQEAPSGTS